MMGIYGSAIALVFTRLFMASAFYIISRRYQKVDYEWYRVGKIIMTSIAIYMCSYFYQTANIIIGISYKTSLLVLFPISLYILGFYKEDEKRKIIDILRNLSRYLKSKQDGKDLSEVNPVK